MFKGIIYKCICIETNKVYIGLTIRTLKVRLQQHVKDSFNENNPGYNYHFHRAIRKYGKENFKWDIVETVMCDNLDNLLDLLDILEIKYIKMYDSYHNGYNSTPGGNSGTKTSKEIIAFEENGTIIGIYESSNHASEVFKISKGVVWLVCSRYLKYANTLLGRIVFRYKGDNYLESEILEVKLDNHNKKVYAYNLDGVLINIFNTAQEAAKFYDVGMTLYISRNCLKTTSFVLCKDERLIFRYDKEIPTSEELLQAKAVLTDCKKCVKAINSRTLEFIQAFRTMADAGRAFNTKGNKVSECCSGKRKTSGKHNGDPVRYEAISYEEYLELIR